MGWKRRVSCVYCTVSLSRSSPSKLFLYYATQWPVTSWGESLWHQTCLPVVSAFPSCSLMILQCHNNVMISTKVLISRSDVFEYEMRMIYVLKAFYFVSRITEIWLLKNNKILNEERWEVSYTVIDKAWCLTFKNN